MAPTVQPFRSGGPVGLWELSGYQPNTKVKRQYSHQSSEVGPMTNLFLLAALWATAALAAPTAVQYLSYNIQSGSGYDHVYNLSRTAEALRWSGAEVVGLQEVDLKTKRHPDDQPAILAGLAEFKHREYGKMRDFQGGGYGIAILSKFPIASTQVLHYKNPNGSVVTCGDPLPRDYCQGALATLVEIAPRRFVWMVTTHIGLYDVQLDEVVQLMRFVKGVLLPISRDIIITGDFNSVPASAAIRKMSQEFKDVWIACGDGSEGFTFDSHQPFERIDCMACHLIPPNLCVCNHR